MKRMQESNLALAPGRVRLPSLPSSSRPEDFRRRLGSSARCSA